MINCTIRSKFKEQDKVFITSFKKGKIAVQPERFLNIMMSTVLNKNPGRQERSGAPQIPAYGPTQHPSAQQTVPPLYPALRSSQPSYPHAGTSDLRPSLPPAPTIMLKTRLRYGRISNRPEDIMYWKPGWAVPDNIEKDLLRQHSKIPEADFVILSDEKGELMCQVYDKNTIPELAPDEFVKLKTRLYSGQISCQPRDVEIFAKNWKVPDEIVKSLKSQYRTTPNAKLFIISDSKNNLRYIVQVGTFSKVLSGISDKVENIFI